MWGRGVMNWTFITTFVNVPLPLKGPKEGIL
jgi:hypothetical protein